MPDGIFYVYELIDPRDGRVFYVGKGQARRPRAHINEARRWMNGTGVFGRNLHKLAVLSEILKAGLIPETRIVLATIDEDAAYKVERDLISGRGELTNKAPGGEGGRPAGFRVAESTKNKIRERLKGRRLAPEHAAKMIGRAPANKGTRASEQLRRKLSDAQRNSSVCVERLKLIHEARRGTHPTEDTRRRMSAAQFRLNEIRRETTNG